MMDWLAGLTIPEHSGFTLIGNADTGNLFGADSSFAYSLSGSVEAGLPDIQGAMFNPAGIGEVLFKLALGLLDNFIVAIK